LVIFLRRQLHGFENLGTAIFGTHPFDETVVVDFSSSAKPERNTKPKNRRYCQSCSAQRRGAEIHAMKSSPEAPQTPGHSDPDADDQQQVERTHAAILQASVAGRHKAEFLAG
jgi:hypothetical protein